MRRAELVQERMLRPIEVAERLRVSITTVWRLARKGKFGDRRKVGRKVTLFSEEAVNRYLASVRVEYAGPG